MFYISNNFHVYFKALRLKAIVPVNRNKGQSTTESTWLTKLISFNSSICSPMMHMAINTKPE